jgi:hypothetical protein
MILAGLYLQIVERLKNSSIKHIDLFAGQYIEDPDNDHNVFLRPAVFLEFEQMAWQSLANKKQAAVINFNIHIVSEPVIEESHNNQPNHIINKALEHLSTVDEVCKKLHGFSGVGFGSISRIGTIFDHAGNAEKVTVIQFKCRLTDIEMMNKYIEANPEQEIITNFINQQ